ncbi:hypothetical protein, partial [uncultured Parasutterella sp.]|uniref:hypothetical protein n=1 Tax=uncultured Parasutterella sp. TaxID=1263098 RepID=UPI0026346FC3
IFLAKKESPRGLAKNLCLFRYQKREKATGMVKSEKRALSLQRIILPPNSTAPVNEQKGQPEHPEV